MRPPTSLKDAKALFKQERAKIASSVSAIAGSRWLAAILATFVIAFGTHLAYAPARLPPISGLSLAVVGLPPSVDFGYAGEQAKAAREAAARQDVEGRVRELADANAETIPVVNGAGFAAALALLLGNMWIMTRRRRVSRG